MRILCLDIGERRIGLAVSDETATLARGLGSIECSRCDPLEEIRRVAAEYEVSRIVYGLPLRMDGALSPQTEKTLAFVDALKKVVSVPLVPWDERLSSKEAERILISADMSRHKRKRLVDKLAAQIILQNYLDSCDPETGQGDAPPMER